MSIIAARQQTVPRSYAAVASLACLAAVVAANLVLTYGIMSTSLQWRWDLLVAMQGIVFGHVFLLSLWLAWGGSHVVLRATAVTALAFLIGHAVRFRLENVSPWEEFALVGSGVLTAILYFSAMLIPWRLLGARRLSFRPPAQATAERRGMQLGIRHLLVWTFWCALPCGLAQAIAADHAVELLLLVALFSAFGLPLAVTTTLLILGRRRLLWLIAFAAAWGFSSGLKQLVPDMFDTPRMWEFNLAVVVAVGGNLALLRRCGLRMWNAGRNSECQMGPPATSTAP